MTTQKKDIITNDFSAQILADSLGPNGKRLTTMAITFPRIVLAELNTHRVFSRNAASSRAIPVKRMLENIKTHPFIPLEFQKPHSGMQGKECYTGLDLKLCVQQHLKLRDHVVEYVERQLDSDQPITKQILNRYLEPWMWTTVIVSSTDWDNFFSLRWTEHAEIHMKHITELMLKAYLKSTPVELEVGDWHIPLFHVDQENKEAYNEFVETLKNSHYEYPARCIVSAVNCARVSYLNFDGEVSYMKDLQLYEQLMSSGHMSPFEHVAISSDMDMRFGNFDGWTQLRFRVPNESRGFDYASAASQLFGGCEALPNPEDPREVARPASWSAPTQEARPPMPTLTHDETPDAGPDNGLSTSGVEVFDEQELSDQQERSES